MTKAEEAALKAYPVVIEEHTERDLNKPRRLSYIKGYEQAEKDIISIIESRLSELLGDAQPTPTLRAELRDLIKKIKEEE